MHRRQIDTQTQKNRIVAGDVVGDVAGDVAGEREKGG